MTKCTMTEVWGTLVYRLKPDQGWSHPNLIFLHPYHAPRSQVRGVTALGFPA